MTYENQYVAGRGTTALGIVGTVLGGLATGGGLLGMGMNAQPVAGQQYVTKDTLDLAMRIAAKDSEIALLKSEQATEVKIADVYSRVMATVNGNKREQDAINRDQAVYNATNSSALSLIGSQVHDLRAVIDQITTLHIPANKVCPEPMPRYNSWAAPTQATAPAAG